MQTPQYRAQRQRPNRFVQQFAAGFARGISELRGMVGADQQRRAFNLLRAQQIECPALLISADHAAQLRNAAREAGCELLHKPIRPLALRSVLRRLQ